jgi:hypothetical protein
MLRSADDEAKLNAVNRSSGSSTNRHRRESRGGRYDNRKDLHPYRSDKVHGNKNPGFPQQNKYVSPPLKIISPVDRTPTPVGGRLGSFASASHRFSRDPWVLNIVSYGLQIDFMSTPTQRSPLPIK